MQQMLNTNRMLAFINNAKDDDCFNSIYLDESVANQNNLMVPVEQLISNKKRNSSHYLQNYGTMNKPKVYE